MASWRDSINKTLSGSAGNFVPDRGGASFPSQRAGDGKNAFQPTNYTGEHGIAASDARKLARVACEVLLAVIMQLDDAGYGCEALNDLYAYCGVIATTDFGTGSKPFPEHVVRSAIEYRRSHGRSY